MATTQKSKSSTNRMKGTTGLASWAILLYEKYRDNRKPLQDKWDRNYNNMHSISDVEWKKDEGKGWRSTTFLQKTRTKVMMAFAILQDNVLGRGDVPFDLDPAGDDEVKLQDLPSEQADEIRADIDDMSQTVDGQLTDSKADRQLLANALSMITYGETYAKQLVHEVVRKGYRQKEVEGLGDISRLSRRNRQFEKYNTFRNSPLWLYVPVWDIFRDLETDDLNAGQAVIHRVLMSPYELRKRLKQPLFFDEEIEKVIAENSKETTVVTTDDLETLAPRFRSITNRHKTIRYLELWGRAPKKHVEEFKSLMKSGKFNSNNLTEIPSISNVEQSGEEIEIVIGIANNRIVMFTENDPDNRVFERAIAEEDLDEIGGRGIPDNLEGTQTVLNGLIRAMEDNAKLANNVIIAVKKSLIEKMDDELKPGAKVFISEACEDVRQAIQTVVIPYIGDSLERLLGIIDRYMDDDSMVPKVVQGMPEAQEQTAFEVNTRVLQATKYLGMVIKNLDEGIIEPMVTRFYDYNMDDSDLEVGKGNYTVKATGYAKFKERVVETNIMLQFYQLVSQNEAAASDYKTSDILTAVGKNMGVNTERFKKTDEEKAQEAQAVQELQANNEQLQLSVAKQKADIEKIQVDNQVKVATLQADRQKDAADVKIQIEELELKRAELVAKIEEMKSKADESKKPVKRGLFGR